MWLMLNGKDAGSRYFRARWEAMCRGFEKAQASGEMDGGLDFHCFYSFH